MKPLSSRSAPFVLGLGCLMLASTVFAQPRGGGRYGGGFGSDGGPPHGGPGMGRGAGGGHGHGHGHGPGKLLRELIDPCGAACAAQARDCRHSTHDGVKACAEASCNQAIVAAREICPAGERPRGDSGCREAMHTLMECVGPCFETQLPVIDACRDSEDACRSACGESTDSQ